MIVGSALDSFHLFCAASEVLSEVSGRQSIFIQEIAFEVVDCVSHKVRHIGRWVTS